MILTEKNIFKESRKGNLKVLEHYLVDKIHNLQGRTPLHNLAHVAKNKNKILEHPSIDRLKDNKGRTPLHILVKHHDVSWDWLKKKYPWFDFEDRELDIELIDDILKYTNNAARFIFEGNNEQYS